MRAGVGPVDRVSLHPYDAGAADECLCGLGAGFRLRPEWPWAGRSAGVMDEGDGRFPGRGMELRLRKAGCGDLMCQAWEVTRNQSV